MRGRPRIWSNEAERKKAERRQKGIQPRKIKSPEEWVEAKNKKRDKLLAEKVGVVSDFGLDAVAGNWDCNMEEECNYWEWKQRLLDYDFHERAKVTNVGFLPLIPLPEPFEEMLIQQKLGEFEKKLLTEFPENSDKVPDPCTRPDGPPYVNTWKHDNELYQWALKNPDWFSLYPFKFDTGSWELWVATHSYKEYREKMIRDALDAKEKELRYPEEWSAEWDEYQRKERLAELDDDLRNLDKRIEREMSLCRSHGKFKWCLGRTDS